MQVDSWNDRRLLDCLCAPMSQTARVELESLSETDWKGVVASSYKHGTHSLLYHRLTSGSTAPKVPEKVVGELREAYLISGLRNALLYQDLAQVLQALRQDQIPVIALKGACLAEIVYANPALRPMGDLDLMVARADLARTSDRLRALGYSCENHDIEECCLRANHLPSFTKPPHPRVELHWTLLMPTLPIRPDLDGLWKRARPATLAGVGALVLSPADLLLHLCAHTGGAANGAFSLGLRPLCDLAAVIQHYQEELDWKEVASRAREWRAAKCVFLTLLLAKTMLAARVPEEVLQSLRPGDFEDRWLALARSVVLAGEADTVLQPVKAFADSCATASLRDRVKYVLRTAFPSRQHMASYMAEKYSLPLTPLRSCTCYWTRGMDLLGRGVRLAWRWSVRRRETSLHVRQLRQQPFLQKWLDRNDP